MQRLGIALAFLIISVAMVLMAVISIQNITAISLQFLFFRSVEIPFGIWLALTFSIGLLLGVILPWMSPFVTRRATRRGN